MRVLSDFDGVLTDIAREAARVTEYFLDRLWEADPGDEGPLPDVMASAYADMEAEPHEHGWRVGGRLTAFANEDGFVRVNGLAACLDGRAAAGDPGTREVLQGLRRNGFESFGAVAQKAYENMTQETAAGRIKPLDPDAVRVLKMLMERGDEIVVVSNSVTDRICALLRTAGLSPAQDAGPGGGQLRVRGGARKFVLGGEPRFLEMGPYRIPTNRPHYEQILIEERPAVIIGDVFSLDLGLPLDLIKRGARGFTRPRLLLRRRQYTPAWAVSVMRSPEANAITRCEVIDRIEVLGD